MTQSTAPVISDVASALTADGATITWTTDVAADSEVQYGLDATYGQHASDAAEVTSHAVTLSGLQPSTTYHYLVTSTESGGGSASGTDATFTTTAGTTAGTGTVTPAGSPPTTPAPAIGRWSARDLSTRSRATAWGVSPALIAAALQDAGNPDFSSPDQAQAVVQAYARKPIQRTYP